LNKNFLRRALKVFHQTNLAQPSRKAMQLPITDAKARLTDLIRRAEASEDVMLTRHGQAVVRLVAMHAKPSAKNRARVIDAARAKAATKAAARASAARSQDFLDDDDGWPK
jgi:prevent-host-death family protein